jgi:hypothetical protein
MGGPDYAKFGDRVHVAELMYGQKPIMATEQTITSWPTVDWKDEMSQEELLAARIRQLQRRPEDVEQAAERLRAARVRNKERFDRTHRLRPKKIEEGDWVLIYDNSVKTCDAEAVGRSQPKYSEAERETAKKQRT